MFDSLPFLFCVVVLAATGAATVKSLLPNGPSFQEDKQKLELLAWAFSAGAIILLTALVILGDFSGS